MLLDRRVFRRAIQLTAASAAIIGGGAVGGCLTYPVEPQEPHTTSTVVARLSESSVDKIDLLLMIDNSRSMADKQQILVEAVPDLVRGLVNPNCVDPTTGVASAQQPAGPLDPCPDPTSKRDFPPVVDIHIGIITSSLGGHGSDSCPANGNTTDCPAGQMNLTNNDMGHLVSRTDPCMATPLATYQNQGFLAWDPSAKDTPPGEANIGAINIDPTTGTVTTTTPGLVPSLKDMVLGTGQIGCGYEAQLESWYRFLIDPEPYASLVVGSDGKATPMGTDDALLQQRKEFLRANSLLAIIGLTDENDCSTKEYSQFWFANQQLDPNNASRNFYLPKARTECATNPNDKCCASTGQNPPAGCPAEPNTPLDAKSDNVNLRCWDQKRRFGIDFMYPIDRYVAGLTQPKVPNRAGEMVDNPIFSDLSGTSTTGVRDASLVFLAFIAGVPWQDIARDPNDLTQGFKDATELAKPDANGKTTWDYIIGTPFPPDGVSPPIAPLDPHMIESSAPRTGVDPLFAATIAPPSATEAGSDPVNGHEYTTGTVAGVQVAPNDLEYACIFALPTPRDCSDMSLVSCDCGDAMNDNPLCAANGAKGRTLQKYAKGYPGIRELSLVKAVGQQGIVGSICPKQLTDLNAADFGYRPAIGAIIDRLKVALGGQCLPRKLNPDPKTGEVQCLILEARNTGKNLDQAACDAFCSDAGMNPGRQPVQTMAPNDHRPAVLAAQADPSAKNSHWDCFCEIKQFTGATTPGCTSGVGAQSELDACQCDASSMTPSYNGNPLAGWCYVDGTTQPTVGNPQIVSGCPDTEKRLVRFVGQGVPATGSTLFITCAGEGSAQ